MKSHDDAEPESLLLRGARIVLPSEVLEGAGLLVEAGRISRIFTEQRIEAQAIEAPAPQRVLTLDGLTLYPGFIDAHIHGAVGVDTMEADADELHEVSRFLARQGVTGWLPTLVPGPAEDYERAAGAVEQLMKEQEHERAPAARVLGLHYEGPFVNRAQCGALRTEYFRSFNSVADLEALAIPLQTEAARMMTLAPEIEGGLELIGELKRRGWVVSVGHTRAEIGLLERARETGARHMTHFMNAMPPLHHRSPGPVGWGLTHDDVTCDLIADGIHLDPLTLRIILRCKTPARLNLISDAVAPAGLGDGDYQLWGETISVTGGHTRNEKGSIAGSVSNLRDGVRMMSSLGVEPVDLSLMASTNPAQLLNLDRFCGSIEEEKRADLVALDEKGDVRLTLVGGRIAFQDRLEPQA